MRKKIVIGTRSSKLALWQAGFVAECLKEEYPGLEVEMKLMTTKGDKILDAPLAKIGGKGLFTKELEQEMLEGGIDLAVHSLKDMPTEVPEGLVIAAITKRADPGDAVVSLKYGHFADLPADMQDGPVVVREMLPDVQNGVEGDAFISRGGSVENQDVHDAVSFRSCAEKTWRHWGGGDPSTAAFGLTSGLPPVSL